MRAKVIEPGYVLMSSAGTLCLVSVNQSRGACQRRLMNLLGPSNSMSLTDYNILLDELMNEAEDKGMFLFNEWRVDMIVPTFSFSFPLQESRIVGTFGQRANNGGATSR